MRRFSTKRVFFLGVAALALVGGSATAAVASVKPTPPPSPKSVKPTPPPAPSSVQVSATCTGTLAAPGILAGTYSGNVFVNGVCFVNGGAANIPGNLTIGPAGALVAAYALNDQPGGTGSSSLTVTGNVIVGSGATLVMGCEPNFFPCLDNGALTGRVHVLGSLMESQPLGVLVHASTINGSVSEVGSSVVTTCAPPWPGVFGFFGSPVYSDYENNTIGGNLTVSGLQTCWFGALRNTVSGSISYVNNTMADPDASEVVGNVVHGNMACAGNSPAVQFGDSGAAPNAVGGAASGQCAFTVFSADPDYGAGGTQPISVKVTF